MRLFIAFRVFFNSRFYYPVFTILFLDFGLSLGQFAILNAVWAATIVLMEVPSGALADIIGRRKLMITAGALMIGEMLILCLVPGGDPTLLFPVFLFNRILSGTAEAAASGADEALAYDSLKNEGMEYKWPRVLEIEMRYRSIAFIFAMTIGAAVYDPNLMRKVMEFFGSGYEIGQGLTLRFPLFLTLFMSVLTLWTCLLMTESPPGDENSPERAKSKMDELAGAFLLTVKAGRWILKTPYALVIILTGLLFDGIIRMVITLSSQYYRVIEIPEALFGLIGSAMALMGLIVPRLASVMTTQWPAAANLCTTAFIAAAGLFGMSFFLPVFGVAFAVILVSASYFTGFFISFYLNRITHSAHRATVLSFKGLSFHLAYGFFGILYSMVLAWIRQENAHLLPGGAAGHVEEHIFISSFSWFPWTFILLFLSLSLFTAFFMREKKLWKIE